ncbi:MAG: DegT/DnrJ/EryC1/StrS aminotransferase family protein [Chloroflexi bacterium]|nr:DegT/DnrJ/EryC1/StrS aminotransferase family protein [Chloroflexota bacterium]
MIPIASPVLEKEEIDAVVGVLRSRHLVQGKIVEQFEKQLAEVVGVKHALAVSSGTAALHLALLAHGIGPGDEVITTPFTFIATANAVLYTGARPVFADICDDTLNLDPSAIEAKITKRTKAILPTHLYGCPADMAALHEIASNHHLAIIEDAAQAIGAAIGNKPAGSFGTGCFSFYATKNITTGEGGAITTDHDEIAEQVRMLRNQGQRAKYDHPVLGYNYRLTDLQAAIGLAQLNRLEEFTSKRIANAGYLNANLPSGITPSTPAGYKHVYHQYTIRVRTGRDEVATFLNAAGIGTGIHYPIPVHKQQLYVGLGYNGTLPVAERASSEVLSLPVHPSLTTQDLETIVQEVRKCLPL